MRKKEYKYLIGIDEAGRGPLAGPVAVGAFLIPVSNLMKAREMFRGVRESKQLNHEKREYWFSIIQDAREKGLIDFKVTFESEKIIDDRRRGLTYAIKSALKKSLDSVVANVSIHRSDDNSGILDIFSRETLIRDCRVLLDGGLRAPIEYPDQETIIKGDEKKMVIALASICAKVLRDRKLVKLAIEYPQYGFDIHKGYGTKAHYVAIRKYGVSPIHRRSFLKGVTKARPLMDKKSAE